MSCISPLQVRQKGERHTVPCGQCAFCLEEKRNAWSFRLQKELRYAKTAHFLTLTYTDENVPIVDCEMNGQIMQMQSLDKTDHTKFMKRLRKQQKEPIRYFMVGEYGSRTGRPHYHYILFNVRNEVIAKIDQIWNLGFVQVGKVTDASIHYTTKYCITKHEVSGQVEKPFNTMSRNPGLGTCYLNDNWRSHKMNQRFFVRDGNGYLHKLSRFYSDKIFGKLEKEKNKIKTIQVSDNQLKKLDEKLNNQNKGYDIECLKVQLTQKAINHKLKFQTKSEKL